MQTEPGSAPAGNPPASASASHQTYRSGEELWRLLDYSTGKRIKGHWRDVAKMIELFTRANQRHAFGMSTDEIVRLAQHIHDANRPIPGTIEEYVAMWPRPLDRSPATASHPQIDALLALDALVREL